MSSWLGLALWVFVPHLIEEHLMGMADDPIIVAALAPLSTQPRHAAYLTFQVMWTVTLATAWLVSLGGRWRLVVLAVLAVALLAETHHVIRAAIGWRYNPGLLTVWPMPFVGAWMLRYAVRAWAATPAS